MAKARRRKPRRDITLPTTAWDCGADGPANRIGLVIEDAGEFDPVKGKVVNPNGVKHARRRDMIEIWHRQGVISTAGYNAAVMLRDAFEWTERSNGWPDSEKVDSSARPDVSVAIKVDQLTKYHKVAKFIPPEDWPIIDACVLCGAIPASRRLGYSGRRYKDGLALLAAALDRMALAMEGRLDRRSAAAY